ncbi:MAG TPA: hypothetical protein VJ455_04070 [Ignavibacteria bacterium]|nr:hypothetical protein [Ignavibacteria bacterium]
MSKTVKTNLFSLLFAVLIALFIYSCGEDSILNTTTNPPDTSCTDTTLEVSKIKGKVTFVDTNFIRTGGVYLISAYPRSSWPPMGPPTSYDTLRISGNNLSYCYSLQGITGADTNYVVTIGFRKTTGGASPVMSVYGCDTNHNISCWLMNPATVRVGSTSGARYINMLSWSDTTKKLY